MLVAFCLIMAFSISCSWKCDYYFKYHKDLGLSIYAGHIFEPFDVFDVGVGVPVPLNLVYSGNELVNYVEGYNSTHALLTLGLGMLLNHNENPNKINIRKFLSEDPPLITFPSNLEHSIDILFEYSASIDIGDQLFVHYGEEWFEERGMPLIDTAKYLVDKDSSPKFPGCIKQYASIVDGKLIAKRNISEGVAIEITRSIFIPSSPSLLSYKGPFADILWWVNAPSAILQPAQATVTIDGNAFEIIGSDFSHAVLLSGYGAFYGVPSDEDSSSRIESANVEPRWEFDLIGKDSRDELPELVKFVAIKPIVKGDELIVSNLRKDTFTQRKVFIK